MRVRIKICGVTTQEAVDASVAAGADAIGFVFALSSRQLTPAAALPLVEAVPTPVTSVGVFRYPTDEELEAVLADVPLDAIQAEPGRGVVKRVPARRLLPVFHDSDDLLQRTGRFRETYGTQQPIVIEGPGRGGRGVRPNWIRASSLAQSGLLVLAGGLTPENVGEAIDRVRPFAVDVSSGVETDGVKDPDRIHAFVEAVRTTERNLLA